MSTTRTSAPMKAKQIAKQLRKERPDYFYLKEIFKYLRKELDIKVQKTPKKLPYVPTEEEMTKYYKEVWDSKNIQNMVIIKVLLYTGIRVGELVKVKIEDVDLDNGTIKVINGKGGKDRIVPFPTTFKEVLAMHINAAEKKEAKYLFESVRREAYSERGIRKILMNYTKSAGMDRSISPHKLRHFLFTWMKKQGIDDALIQPFSGHDSRKSLEIYSKLSITDAQNEYNKIINKFPI